MRVFIAIVWVVVITACTHSDQLLVGKTRTAIAPDKVTVWYPNPGNCDFEVVAFLSTPGDHFSRAGVVNAFKEKAAAIGANTVHITQLERLGAREFHGAARALYCQR